MTIYPTYYKAMEIRDGKYFSTYDTEIKIKDSISKKGDWCVGTLKYVLRRYKHVYSIFQVAVDYKDIIDHYGPITGVKRFRILKTI